LKDFSLTGYIETNAYDNEVITLIRRMTQLEKLTLYIRVYRLARFTDGNHLHNEILIHIPRVHTFLFYISTQIYIDASVHRLLGEGEG
jgi:hypothetical protein